MHEVEPVLEGSEYQTDVWAATERVLVAMEKLRKKKALLVDRFFKLIKKCAVAGFGLWQRTNKSRPIRGEWRICHR